MVILLIAKLLYWSLFVVIILGVICGYSIGGYGGYFINGY